MTNKNYNNNEELVFKYQNGDDYAFTELFELNEGLIHEMVKRYNYIKIVDKETMISACHQGFFNASKTYREDMNTKFSTYCMRIMNNEIIRELTYLEQKGRKNLLQNQLYMNQTVQSKDGGETEMVWLMDVQEPTEYFEGEFLVTNDAIEYAMDKSKAKYKDCIVPIICGDYTLLEVGEQHNTSAQAVKYHVDRFKKFMKEFMELDGISSLQQAFD